MTSISRYSLLIILLLGACGETKTVVTEKIHQLVELREATAEQCPMGGTLLVTDLDSDEDGVLDEEEISSTQTICDGTDGTDGRHSLIRTTSEAPGANCSEGGVRVQHGLDDDADGLPDDDEVDGTEYVCNGLPGSGTNSIVNVVEEPAGTHCASGGFAIQAGPDTNGDGLLQPGELENTVYVCHGDSGSTSLVRREDEPDGANCPYGGQRVRTGIDADGNGYLDDMEASSSFCVCNGADGHDDEDGVLSDPEVDQTQYVCNMPDIFVSISAGGYGACGLKANGTLWCWGYGASLGNGVNADRAVPTPVLGTEYNNSYNSISHQMRHACATLSSMGFCWGSNSNGQLGNNSTTNSNVLVQVSGMTFGIQAVSAGSYHACAIRANNAAWCWGTQSYGSLGNGEFSGRSLVPTPVLPSDSALQSPRAIPTILNL